MFVGEFTVWQSVHKGSVLNARRPLNVVHFMRHPQSGAFSIERVYADVREALPADIAVREAYCRFRSAGIFRRLWNALEARRFVGDVNHITGDVHFVTYFLPRRRTILTIHDCEVLERSCGLKRWLLWFFWFWLPEKRCARIVAISDESKRRILLHLNCDPDKVEVIHNPLSASFKPVERPFNATKPRILHIGTKANKNLEGLVEAVRGLDVTLMIIGELSQGQRELLSKTDVDFENRVNLREEELLNAYADADIVAFVSKSEGFGLPIIEAQTVGRPVLTSNIAPMNEVAGSGAFLVDPHSTDAIRKGLARLIDDADLRQSLVKAGFANAQRFSAERAALSYATLYRQIATGQQA